VNIHQKQAYLQWFEPTTLGVTQQGKKICVFENRMYYNTQIDRVSCW